MTKRTRADWYDAGHPLNQSPAKDGSLAMYDGWARLAAGVLAAAALEARAGDLAAAEWLQGESAALFADVLGANARAITSKAASWATYPAGKIVIRLFVKG